MKFLLFLFLLSSSYYSFGQEIVTAKRVLSYSELELSHNDSIFIKKYNDLLKIKNKYDSLVFDLEKLDYSENLKRIIYEQYIINLDKNIDKKFNIILSNSEKYELYGETHDSGRINNKKYIISNNVLFECLAKYILNKNLLRSCEFFSKKINIENQVYNITTTNSFPLGYVEYIAFLLRESVAKLKKLKATTSNQCLIENIDYIIKTGKKIPYLKEFYNK